MGRAALKIVERSPFYTEEIELWSPDRPRDAHSLHYALSLPGAFRPEVPAYFIERFTEKGAVILDPFCGGGTTALEANLRGRVAVACDANPLALRTTRAKLSPADISEVTLHLQFLNTGLPVNLDVYEEFFAPFFDINTFRELVNLRRYFSGHDDRISQFVELIATSLLHGHSAGFFSVYTFPQVSLSPAEQIALNDKRSQLPDYRATMPRVLRKAAAALRDGIPSVLARTSSQNTLLQCDARDLIGVATGSVDLVVTAPPLPRSSGGSGRRGRRKGLSDLWVKLWFNRIAREDVEPLLFASDSLEDWLEFMNEVLVELARVVLPGGRAVFDLRKLVVGSNEILLDEELTQLVEGKLSRYWEAEAMFLAKERSARLKNSLKERETNRTKRQSRLLVLRRR